MGLLARSRYSDTEAEKKTALMQKYVVFEHLDTFASTRKMFSRSFGYIKTYHPQACSEVLKCLVGYTQPYAKPQSYD